MENTLNDKNIKIIVKIETIADWLKEKTQKYKQNQEKTLENMFEDTLQIMKQYKNNIFSKAVKEAFNSCIKCNEIFLANLNNLK